ncbi:MAG: hypothetical protein GY859_16440, partial [Desulfobacterales bacterium]|nr:hypothetical protein [Desulfobacterales bacterium]
MDRKVSIGVWTGVDETSLEALVTYESERVNMGDAAAFTAYTADKVGVIAKTLTVNGATLP